MSSSSPGPGSSPDAQAAASRERERGMLTDSTSFADAVHQLLAVVRTQLGMQVAWVSEFVGPHQVLRFVDAAPGASAPAEGTSLPLSSSFCARVLDGRLPAVIPDAHVEPVAALLDVTPELRIGSYVGVPLRGQDGGVSGMLCAVHEESSPDLSERDAAALRLLVQLLHDLSARAVSAERAVEERDRVRRALTGILDGHGRHTVLQPIVDLVTGRAVAAEALTRFTVTGPDAVAPWPPATWFAESSRLGLRDELELATAQAGLDLLDEVPPDVVVSVNLGPQALLGGALPVLLDGRPLDRVVVEMTEHAVVEDYGLLAKVLDPFREQGLQVAVDDAGAGYASLQHVLAVQPDLIKIDIALVRGADGDLPRRTLLTALADFAEATSCRLVAEGVETDGELRAVAACGVHLAQGHLLAPPSRTPAWSGFAVP